MRKVAKVILIAGGILLLGIVAAVLSANLYIESKDSQARIERKLSRVLHAPVKITATSFSLWSGLRVNGVTIPQEEELQSQGNFFEATSFSATFDYFPLLSRKLRIQKINVIKPQLAWYQSGKGKWRVPSTPAKPAVADESARLSAAPPKKPVKPFDISIDKLLLSDGDFRFFDHKQNSLFSFLGVNAEGHLVSPAQMNGSAESATASIRDAINLQHIRTEFSYGDKILQLKPIRAKVAEGNFSGEFKIETASQEKPFALKAEFNNADVNRLITDAGGASGQVTGLLSGSLELTSNTHKMKDFTGKGKFSLSRGRVQQYDLFAMLGQALQIEELTQLNLQQAELEYRFSEGKILVDQLLLQSPNLKLTGTGTIRTDGKMNLNARLTINQTISRQLPGFVAENFHPAEGADAGLQFIDFDVTGSVAKPRTNLLELAVGKKIEREMGGFFNALFGSKKRKEPKKPEEPKKQEQPAPQTPAQSPTPAPAQTPALTPVLAPSPANTGTESQLKSQP